MVNKCKRTCQCNLKRSHLRTCTPSNMLLYIGVLAQTELPSDWSARAACVFSDKFPMSVAMVVIKDNIKQAKERLS